VKFQKQFKIELVCADNPKRCISGVYHDKTQKRLCATDGKMLVSIPVEENQDDAEGFIPPEAIKGGRDNRNPEATLEVHENTVAWTNKKGQRMEDRLIEGTFPKYENHLRPLLPKKTQQLVVLRLDPSLLFRLVQALGCSFGKNTGDTHHAVTLQFLVEKSDGTARDRMLVSADDGVALGVLMPMKPLVPTEVVEEKKEVSDETPQA
jgi:hypothetical protein